MRSIRICNDLDECKFLWQRLLRDHRHLFLQWEIRDCFQQTFHRAPCFIVCEDCGRLLGLLPLSHIDETDSLSFFPGETWHGKTWLEQNRIFAQTPEIFQMLLDSVPGDARLRYIDGAYLPPFFTEASVDEIGYLFSPEQYAYDFPTYLEHLPRKTRKHLQREPNRLRELGVTFRYDARHDIDDLFRMNLEAFGDDSYFHDDRFLLGFERLIGEMDRRRILRVTTVLVAGRIAAVDLGVVWNNTYTLLAGGTNRDFPGVAKLINFHHLEIACRERFDQVDFLCGDFGWKKRFRLVPRPFYEIMPSRYGTVEESIEGCATSGATTGSPVLCV